MFSFLGIIFCIGALIDEAQGDQRTYDPVTKMSHSRSRLMLVCAWLIGCFLLTNMYRSIFRAMMMTIEYDPTIDTLDDLLMSEMQIMLPADTGMKGLWETDPRERVQNLSKQVVYFKYGSTDDRDRVNAGQVN